METTQLQRNHLVDFEYSDGSDGQYSNTYALSDEPPALSSETNSSNESTSVDVPWNEQQETVLAANALLLLSKN